MREPLCISSKGARPLSLDLPVCSVEALAATDLDAVSFLLLDLFDWRLAHRQLRQIRTNVNPRLYLKPVVFYGSADTAPRDVLQAADGLIRGDREPLEQAVSAWSAKVEPVNARIRRVVDLSSDGDSNMALKVLRFIETRDGVFKPIPTASKTSGYVYPQLQPLFPRQDVGVIETLDFLESQKLLAGQFINRSYACTHCGCAFLNFIETCPDCGSSELRTDELIHHFKCAYVGELADFKQADDLVCPKCDRHLKHIGVDYDKASVVYHCAACAKVFQEPHVVTSCYNCWRDTAPENQVVREIKSYTITAIGENAARYGMDSLFQAILKTKMPAFSYDVFHSFFDLEVARIRRYKVSTSCLTVMRIKGIDRIYERLGSRVTELFHELGETLKTGLRESDILAIHSETIFLVILTETPEEKARVAVSRLKERILSLLTTNLEMEFQVDDMICPLSTEVNLEEIMERFLDAHAD